MQNSEGTALVPPSKDALIVALALKLAPGETVEVHSSQAGYYGHVLLAAFRSEVEQLREELGRFPNDKEADKITEQALLALQTMSFERINSELWAARSELAEQRKEIERLTTLPESLRIRNKLDPTGALARVGELEAQQRKDQDELQACRDQIATLEASLDRTLGQDLLVTCQLRAARALINAVNALDLGEALSLIEAQASSKRLNALVMRYTAGKLPLAPYARARYWIEAIDATLDALATRNVWVDEDG